MFDTKISTDQREYAYELVKNTNFGRRGEFDGDLEKQYTGLLGQVVMADALDMDRPTGAGGFDNGIDFTIYGAKVDLKTMGRTTPVKDYYVNNLVASQINYETEYYVFASINKKTRVMTVIGVLKKENLERYFKPRGTTRQRSDHTEFELRSDMYEIPNKELMPATGWLDLVWTIDRSR